MFRLEYKFKIKEYISGVSLIEAEFKPPVRIGWKKVAMLLPSKIGAEKMKHIVKMRCEKDNQLTQDQKDFIKRSTVKLSDSSIFEDKSQAEFDKLFDEAQEAFNKRVKKLSPKDAYPEEYARLIEYGVSEGAARKIVSLSCKGQDILEMSNGVYCADINGTPKLIEKFHTPGLGLYVYHIYLSIRTKAKEKDNE